MERDVVLLDGAKIRFVNTFDIRVLGFKNLLAEIRHPLIPETIRLDSVTRDTIIHSREKYVLKPANMFEGIGVMIG